MQIISLILIIAYNVASLLYYKRHFPEKRRHWIYYVIAVAFSLFCGFALRLLNEHHIGSIVMWIAFMLELKLLFEMDLLRILHGGGAYIILIYSFRGIIAAIFSIIQHESINVVLQQDFYYHTIAGMAALAAIGFIALIRKAIAPDEKIKYLIRNTNQIKFIVTCQVVYIFYILLINDGRFLDLNSRWFAVLYLESSIIAVALMAFIWNNSVRVCVLLEHELYTRQLQEQLSRQMRHYKSYKKYTESFRAFKHDYKHMMSTVKALIRSNENEKAVKLLDEIHDTMQKNVRIHKTYSDHILLDAILQDTANTCEEKGIRFSATLHMPGSMGLADLDVVRVFSNVLNNALEACVRVPDISERFLEITGSANADWAFIAMANSFSGEIKFKEDELITTKENKDFHGIGLKVVKEIIEGVGGMVLIDVDKEKKIFRLRLHIPRQ